MLIMPKTRIGVACLAAYGGIWRRQDFDATPEISQP